MPLHILSQVRLALAVCLHPYQHNGSVELFHICFEIVKPEVNPLALLDKGVAEAAVRYGGEKT